MIIIVEGIDRVGKTTFCNIMNEKYGARIFKGKSYKNEEIQNISREDLYGIQELGQLEALSESKELIVMDRFHWTEKVYGKILRGYDSKYTEIIDNEIKQINDSKINQIVIMLVKPTDIKWSSEKHGSDLSEYENEFEKLYETSKQNVFSCDFDTLEMAADYLMEMVYDSRQK